jgi:hypothetical protein
MYNNFCHTERERVKMKQFGPGRCLIVLVNVMGWFQLNETISTFSLINTMSNKQICLCAETQVFIIFMYFLKNWFLCWDYFTFLFKNEMHCVTKLF